jgi:putative peptidoglycan lipid II flippase
MIALLLVWLAPLLLPYMTGELVIRGGALAFLIGGGGLAYLVAARLLGLFTVTELRRQFSRKGNSS